MNKKKTLLSLIGLVALLMVASISYLILADRNPYKYYTGLGNGLSISEDDQLIAFSYYHNGSAAIYTADQEGKNVEKVSNPKDTYHSEPRFSPDGKKILYLSRDRNRVQSLYIADIDGTNPHKLSTEDQHVSGAVFSDNSNTIYFASTPASEVNKTEGEFQEGTDLYSVNIDGSKMEQLTDSDFYTMESLEFSTDSREVLFKDYQDVKAFSLEDGRVYMADFSTKIPSEVFNLSIAPNRKAIAYTAITDKSETSSLFEYDLFIRDLDLDNGATKRLTDLNASVVSPVFFHKRNEILFLEHINWPNDPEEYKLRTVEIETGKVKGLNLDLPELKSGNFLKKAIDYTVNGGTVGLLYTLLLLLLTLYLGPEKLFFPSLISLAIVLLTFAASFVAAAIFDPWAGIGIGMIAAGLFACTFVSFAFAFIMKFIRKGTKPDA